MPKPKIPEFSEDMLNIAEICPQSSSLGPGVRFVLWVQGCPFNCKGCISPDWIPFKKSKLILIRELANQIIGDNSIDGITISGGEPFSQAGRLVKLLELVRKQRPELTIIVFTGFKKKQLVDGDSIGLLKYTDVLISELYIERLNDNKGMRGSSNQKIHFVSDRLLEYEDYFHNKPRNLEVHLRKENYLMVGVPPKGFRFELND